VQWGYGLLALLGVGLGYYVYDQVRLRFVRRKLEGRRPLSAEAWAETYFGNSRRMKRIAGYLREVLSEETGLDLGGLHPDDRFDEMRLFQLNDMFLEELVMTIEDDMEFRIPTEEIQSWRTPRDIVESLDKCFSQAPTHCPTCGYILKGLPSNICPECGKRYVPDDEFPEIGKP
jgi:acyl carrier protein